MRKIYRQAKGQNKNGDLQIGQRIEKYGIVDESRLIHHDKEEQKKQSDKCIKQIKDDRRKYYF